MRQDIIPIAVTKAKKLRPVKCPQTRRAKLAKRAGKCIIVMRSKKSVEK